MYSFPSLSIGTSTPFVFAPFGPKSAKRLTYLEVQCLTGSSDVYVGPYPDVPTANQIVAFEQLTLSAQASHNASSWIMTGDSVSKRRHASVMPGWVIQSSDNAGDIGKYVLKVDGDVLTFNSALSAYAAQALTLSAPFYADITSGFVLSAGMWKSWSAEDSSAFLSSAIKFAVSSGTGLLAVQYDFA